MEKEIKVRKKRFAAFFLIFVLVLSRVLPITVDALNNYTISVTTESTTGLDKGTTVYAGDTITVSASEGSSNTYSVRYNSSDGETLYHTDSVSYGAKYTVLDITDPKLSAVSTQTGTTFAGWDVYDVYASGGVLYSITLDAQFTNNTYTISYELNGGENAASNPTSYTYGTGVDSFAAATKEGHDFEGWYSEPAFATKVESIGATENENITLYAKWNPKSYTISYELNGGTNAENNPTDYTYGTGVESFAGATKDGYTFEGWYSESDFATKVESISATQTANITLYAKFTKPISYELDGGVNAESNPASYVEGVGVPSLASPTKTGHGFLGWYLNDSQVTAIGTDQTGDIMLSARWQANTYNIDYKLDGGTNGNNPTTYTYGEGVASLEDATKDGYVFTGWYNDSNFAEKVESISTTQLENVTLYAKFVSVPDVIEAGTYELISGVQYTLGNVTKVSGDSSVYVSGSTFYVPTSGTYTFS